MAHDIHATPSPLGDVIVSGNFCDEPNILPDVVRKIEEGRANKMTFKSLTFDCWWDFGTSINGRLPPPPICRGSLNLTVSSTEMRRMRGAISSVNDRLGQTGRGRKSHGLPAWIVENSPDSCLVYCHVLTADRDGIVAAVVNELRGHDAFVWLSRGRTLPGSKPLFDFFNQVECRSTDSAHRLIVGMAELKRRENFDLVKCHGPFPAHRKAA